MRRMSKDELKSYIDAVFGEPKKLQQLIDANASPMRDYMKYMETIVGPPGWPDDDFRRLYDSALPKSYRPTSRTQSVVSGAAELQAEVAQLQRDIRLKTEALREHAADSQTKDAEIAALREDLLSLQAKQRLAHLLNRVGSAAQAKLLADDTFRRLFQNAEPCNAYVLSIDIRRSTELMLKAREPRLFAEFMIVLANGLRKLILDNYGVFDKFTGDGILAFFPEFYSGEDAGFRAIDSAARCHALFAEHYRRSRASFKTVMLDTGLGIGIDYGTAQIVEIAGEFTVVGEPVVYACRMASAEAGHTYLNQPAFDRMFPRYAAFDFVETELMIKHEGRTVAYSVRPNGKAFEPQVPEWEREMDALIEEKNSA